MDDKTKSIVAHLYIIGWVIAFVMNKTDKGENTSFYLRQTLGIMVISVFYFFPIYIISLVAAILTIVLYVLSLIPAISGEKKLLPVVGDMFQQWFKGIS